MAISPARRIGHAIDDLRAGTDAARSLDEGARQRLYGMAADALVGELAALGWNLLGELDTSSAAVLRALDRLEPAPGAWFFRTTAAEIRDATDGQVSTSAVAIALRRLRICGLLDFEAKPGRGGGTLVHLDHSRFTVDPATGTVTP